MDSVGLGFSIYAQLIPSMTTRTNIMIFCSFMILIMTQPSVHAQTNTYRIPRNFQPARIQVQDSTLFNVTEAGKKLTGIVGPFSVITNSAYSTEYEAVSWGQSSFSAAWNNVLIGYATHRTEYNEIWDDPGWIKGTKSAYSMYGAYMWLLQNKLTFKTSPDKYYTANGKTFLIEKVYVGTLGEFAPTTTVSIVFPLMDDSSTYQYTNCTFLTSARPSDNTSQTVKYTFDTRAYYKLRYVGVNLVPNFDRDNKIDTKDETRAVAGEKYHFWINDDNDAGYDQGDDIPGQSGLIDPPDYNNDHIDGVRDLVDFFPVWLDIKESLTVFPSAEYSYVLKNADSAFNAFATNLKPESTNPDLSPDAYLYSLNFGNAYGSATVGQVSAQGLNLPEGFLSEIIANDRGIILLEGRTFTDKPLVLEVKKKADGTIVCQTEMSVRIDSVENMYRHINLRPVLGKSGGRATSTGVPTNYPDSQCNEKNVFMAHGFNVSADNARGWHAEVFKRLFWAGSNAKFWGVTWYSDKGSGINYQENVANALATASATASQINAVSGEKIILAHSLGNMLMSSAIAEHGLSASKYFMLNAAVATECYDPATYSTATNNTLLHAEWRQYLPTTWCSEWHHLFSDPNDQRQKLIWQGRFTAVLPGAYNYYSSGDEIFEINPKSVSTFTGIEWDFLIWPDNWERYAWQKNEVLKGRSCLGGTSWTGWSFSGEEDDLTGEFIPEYTLSEANAATTNQLINNPVFNPYPSDNLQSNITDKAVNDMLAMGVPALSPAAGLTNAIPLIGRNNNVDTPEIKENGWPRNHEDYHQRWLHSDLKNMAFLYTYKVFEKITTEGELK